MKAILSAYELSNTTIGVDVKQVTRKNLANAKENIVSTTMEDSRLDKKGCRYYLFHCLLFDYSVDSTCQHSGRGMDNLLKISWRSQITCESRISSCLSLKK